MQKKSKPVSLKTIEKIAEQRQMVLNAIEKCLPNQQKDFLLFMAKQADPISDYSELETTDLLDLFIEFEEDNNDEPLTLTILNDVLEMYVEDFNESL